MDRLVHGVGKIIRIAPCGGTNKNPLMLIQSPIVVIQNFVDGWGLQELSYKIIEWMRFTKVTIILRQESPFNRFETSSHLNPY